MVADSAHGPQAFAESVDKRMTAPRRSAASISRVAAEKFMTRRVNLQNGGKQSIVKDSVSQSLEPSMRFACPVPARPHNSFVPLSVVALGALLVAAPAFAADKDWGGADLTI